MLSGLVLCTLGLVSTGLGLPSPSGDKRPPGFEVLPHPALKSHRSPAFNLPYPPIPTNPYLPYYPYYTPYLLPPPLPYISHVANASGVENEPPSQHVSSIPMLNWETPKKPKKHRSHKSKLAQRMGTKRKGVVNPSIKLRIPVIRKKDPEEPLRKAHTTLDQHKQVDKTGGSSAASSEEKDSDSSGETDERSAELQRLRTRLGGSMLLTTPQKVPTRDQHKRDQESSQEDTETAEDLKTEEDLDDDDSSQVPLQNKKGITIPGLDESEEKSSDSSSEGRSEEYGLYLKQRGGERVKGHNHSVLKMPLSKSSQSSDESSNQDSDYSKENDESISKNDSESSEESNEKIPLNPLARQNIKIENSTNKNVGSTSHNYTANLNKTNAELKDLHSTPNLSVTPLPSKTPPTPVVKVTNPIGVFEKEVKPSLVKNPTLLVWITAQMKKSVLGRAALSALTEFYEEITAVAEHLIGSVETAYVQLATEPAIPGKEETRILTILKNALFGNMETYSKYH